VKEILQTFEPLRTETHSASKANAAASPSVPAGIIRLQRAAREARSAFLAAGLLAFIALVLSAILFLGPGSAALVVWQEGEDRVLVELP
jgi:hypothetical protein